MTAFTLAAVHASQGKRPSARSSVQKRDGKESSVPAPSSGSGHELVGRDPEQNQGDPATTLHILKFVVNVSMCFFFVVANEFHVWLGFYSWNRF